MEIGRDSENKSTTTQKQCQYSASDLINRVYSQGSHR